MEKHQNTKEYIIYKTAEEKVFTIPELRHHILSFIVEPDDIEDDIENIAINDEYTFCDKIKVNCCLCCCIPCIIYKLYDRGYVDFCCCYC